MGADGPDQDLGPDGLAEEALPPPPDVGGPADQATGEGGSLGCAEALLCDDFEKYTTPAALAADWKVTATGSTLQVDGTKAFKGTKALHISAPAGTPNAIITKEGAPLFPIPGNVMFGRMMLWLTQTPPGGYHWNSIQAAGTLPASKQNAKYGWGGQAGKILAGYTVRDMAGGSIQIDCSKPSAMAFPSQRWVCVEWGFDGVKNQMHLWFDGQLVTDADVIKTGTRCVAAQPPNNTWQAPNFENLILGWAQYQASSGPLELWLDDLVVGARRVGCPAP